VAVRVLIVDDHAGFRRAARRTVAFSEGFVVVGEVATGEESLRAVLELDPDLVVMDIRLPGINGFEAARRIVAERKGTVVLIVSGYGSEDVGAFDARVATSGSAGYVPKALFTPERLAQEWAAASSGRR
jgi:DNA-binding NarL/FixJ family response regulator